MKDLWALFDSCSSKKSSSPYVIEEVKNDDYEKI